MLKKLDALMFYVSDVKSTLEFYQTLGFKTSYSGSDPGIASLNKLDLFFYSASWANDDPDELTDAMMKPKGSGLYIYIRVQNIDEYFKTLKTKSLTPSSKPRNWPWGNREFVVRDPDKFKLVFYGPIKEKSNSTAKLKALDSLLLYVSDVKRTAEFYKTLGFKQPKLGKNPAILKLKNFELHFHGKNEENKPEFRKEALSEPKGAGISIHVQVDDINKHKKLLESKNILSYSSGASRQIKIKDPDGYKLVFYSI